MAWTLSEKNRVIAGLQRLLQDGQKLEVRLRVKHPEEDADRIWESNQRLATEIDALIGRVMDDWGSGAAKAASDLGAAASDFKAAADDIAKKVEVAKKIVKAAAALDKAVALARKVLGAIA